jgi:hypothetical protein
MTARLSGLAVAAALAAVGAVALGGGTPGGPKVPRSSPTPVARAKPRSAVVDVATAYAIAARTWTPSTRLAAWRRELALTAGAYHRALAVARPGARALRIDHAESAATVVAAIPTVRGTTAAVRVDLRERTSATGTVVTGVTHNIVSLRLRRGRWWVVGFTVIPRAGS